MGRVLFYHLTESRLEDTLPVLLGKSLAAGYQVDIRGRDPSRLDWLDEKLWLGPQEGFLPHGRAGGPHDAIQPILLTEATALRAGTTCLMAVLGAEVAPQEPAQLARCCILFDGHDAEALAAARGQWKSLTGAGAVAEYWAQVDGRWTRKMTTEAT